jgi:uncharacterized membrane protein (UPF0136 family)
METCSLGVNRGGIVGAMEKGGLRRLGLFALLASFAWLSLQNAPSDPDMFMHLRIGDWIREHGAVPWTDPFSWRQGTPWIAYSWLFELGASEIFEHAGWTGLLLAKAALCVLVALGIVRMLERREPRPGVALALATLGLLGVLGSINIRPWLFSILFLAVTLDRALEARETGNVRRLLGLVPVYVLWANLHIQFVYGLLVLGLLLVESAIEAVQERSPALAPATAAAGLALCAVATLATPYHVHLWHTVFVFATRGGGSDAILELQAPSFRAPRDWVLVAASLLACYALGRRRETRPFPIALLSVLAFLSFHSRRDAWALVLAAVALIPRGGAGELTSLPVLVLIGALGWGAAVLVHVSHLREIAFRNTVVRDYPEEACRFIEERRLAGPLYNPFNWGSYLVWRLRSLPVSMDGRLDVHGADRLARSQRTFGGAPDWKSDPDLEQARIVLVPAEWPLSALLDRDPGWKRVHADPMAHVYVRAER